MSEPTPVIQNVADWPVRTVEELTTLLRRGTAPLYVDESEVLAIGQRCITDSDFDGSRSRPHSARAMSRVLKPEVDDVLINSTGTGTIGRSVIFRDQASRYIVDGHVTVARPRESVVVSRWLNDVLRSPAGQRYLEARCYAGSTNQVELSATALAAMPLAVPSVDEQKQVAQVLDALDGQVRSVELILAKLRAARYGLADHLLSAGLADDGHLRDHRERPADFLETTLGPRPRRWTVAPLREFLERSDYGISTSLSDAGRVPVLRMNNFAGGEAKLGDLKYSNGADAARLSLAEGDVLFNRTNSMEHVGRTGIWRGQLEVASFASYLVRLVPNSKLTNEYLNRLLNLRQTQIDLRRWATPGVHQVNVNPTNLRRVVVAVPESLNEQDRICGVLAQQDARIARETRALSKLRLQKTGLVDDLLTGRVLVPEGLSA